VQFLVFGDGVEDLHQAGRIMRAVKSMVKKRVRAGAPSPTEKNGRGVSIRDQAD